MGAILRLAQDRYVHTDFSAAMRPGDTCSAVRVKTPTHVVVDDFDDDDDDSALKNQSADMKDPIQPKLH